MVVYLTSEFLRDQSVFSSSFYKSLIRDLMGLLSKQDP